MRRSHSFQLLASIIVFLVIALAIIFNVYHYQGRQYNSVIQALSLVSATALGGSFLGTTAFWLLFECDFSNRKRLRKMDDRINKTESIERINQEVIDEIREDIQLIAKTQRRIERSQEEQKRWKNEYIVALDMALDAETKGYLEDFIKKFDSNREPKESQDPKPDSSKS